MRKGVSRRYFLRKLRFFSMCSKMLEIFYHPVVVSVIYFAVVYFAGGQHQCQRCPHDQQLIHKARTIAGQNVQVSESVKDGRSMTNCCPPWTTHHTSSPQQRQQSSFSFGLIQPRYHKDHFRKAFLLFSTRLYNSSCSGQVNTRVSMQEITFFNTDFYTSFQLQFLVFTYRYLLMTSAVGLIFL